MRLLPASVLKRLSSGKTGLQHLTAPSRGVTPAHNDALVKYAAEKQRVLASLRRTRGESRSAEEKRIRLEKRTERDAAWARYIQGLRETLAQRDAPRPPGAPSVVKALVRSPRTRVRRPGEEDAAQANADALARLVAARKLAGLAVLVERLEAEPPVTFETVAAAVRRAIDAPTSYSRAPEEMVAARLAFRRSLSAHVRRIHAMLTDSSDACASDQIQ